MDIETMFSFGHFAAARNGALVLRRGVNKFFVFFTVSFSLESFGTPRITALVRSRAH